MKFSKKFSRLSPFVLAAFCLLIPQLAFSQTEKLGIVKYSPPSGMTKTAKPNVIAFSEYNQTTGSYCIITLYGASGSDGNPTADFSREWNRLVVGNMKAEANPKTDSQTDVGWTAISGGGEVESEAGKAVGYLTVISGFGKTVSILAVFNDPAAVKKIDAFIGSIEMDKITPANNTTVNNTTSTNQPTYDDKGKLIVPPPSRQLTVADFEGEWGEDGSRVTTNYVYRSSGTYAGSDSISFRSKMTITKNGGYINDFFAIQNGKKIIDKTNGTISVNGLVFSIIQADTQKFVLRGWLELPDMTIMIICGPLYDKDLASVIDNPLQGANLNKIWVRKK